MRDGLIIWDRFVPSMCDSAFEYCEYINISQPETALGQKAISGCQGKEAKFDTSGDFVSLKSMKIVIQLIRMSTRQMGQRYYQCHQLGHHIDNIVMMMMVVMITLRRRIMGQNGGCCWVIG